MLSAVQLCCLPARLSIVRYVLQVEEELVDVWPVVRNHTCSIRQNNNAAEWGTATKLSHFFAHITEHFLDEVHLEATLVVVQPYHEFLPDAQITERPS